MLRTILLTEKEFTKKTKNCLKTRIIFRKKTCMSVFKIDNEGCYLLPRIRIMKALEALLERVGWWCSFVCFLNNLSCHLWYSISLLCFNGIYLLFSLFGKFYYHFLLTNIIATVGNTSLSLMLSLHIVARSFAFVTL